MSGMSDGQMEEQIACRYLLKIDEALRELTLDQVRQVVLEIEAHVTGPAREASSVED